MGLTALSTQCHVLASRPNQSKLGANVVMYSVIHSIKCNILSWPSQSKLGAHVVMYSVVHSVTTDSGQTVGPNVV